MTNTGRKISGARPTGARERGADRRAGCEADGRAGTRSRRARGNAEPTSARARSRRARGREADGRAGTRSRQARGVRSRQARGREADGRAGREADRRAGTRSRRARGARSRRARGNAEPTGARARSRPDGSASVSMRLQRQRFDQAGKARVGFEEVVAGAWAGLRRGTGNGEAASSRGASVMDA